MYRRAQQQQRKAGAGAVLPRQQHDDSSDATTYSSGSNFRRKVFRSFLLQSFGSPKTAGAAATILALCLIIAGLTVGSKVARSGQQAGHRQKRPRLPLSSDVKVSVVIMNHSRPRMVRESLLMKTFTEHPAVSEVLLCHSNPETKFNFDHPKVKNVDAIDANRKMGLSLRFHYCANDATNEWVIHVDDDMELSEQAVDDLLAEFHSNPHRIVGRYGRGYNYWKSPQRNGYDTATLDGPVEVVLTKILILEKQICKAFFKYSHLVEEMQQAEGQPLWNGEDIFVNLVANHVYKVPLNGPYNNYAISDLDVWEGSDEYKDDDTGEHDVSGNMDRHRPWNVGLKNWLNAYKRAQIHAAFRGKLWYTAKQRLAAIDDV